MRAAIIGLVLSSAALILRAYQWGLDSREPVSCAEWCAAKGMRVDFHIQSPPGSDGYVPMDDHDIVVDPIDNPGYETCGCLRPPEHR